MALWAQSRELFQEPERTPLRWKGQEGKRSLEPFEASSELAGPVLADRSSSRRHRRGTQARGIQKKSAVSPKGGLRWMSRLGTGSTATRSAIRRWTASIPRQGIASGVSPMAVGPK